MVLEVMVASLSSIEADFEFDELNDYEIQQWILKHDKKNHHNAVNEFLNDPQCECTMYHGEYGDKGHPSSGLEF